MVISLKTGNTIPFSPKTKRLFKHFCAKIVSQFLIYFTAITKLSVIEHYAKCFNYE